MKKFGFLVFAIIAFAGYYVSGPAKEKQIVGNWRMRQLTGDMEAGLLFEMKEDRTFKTTVSAVTTDGQSANFWITGTWKVIGNQFRVKFLDSDVPLSTFGETTFGGRIKQLDDSKLVYTAKDGEETWHRENR